MNMHEYAMHAARFKDISLYIGANPELGNEEFLASARLKDIQIAEGAALQAGCRLETSNYETSYDEMMTNRALSDAFTANLVLTGIPQEDITEGEDHVSMDIGNVSLHCPAIHPYIQVIDEKHALHTPEFHDLAMQDRALEGMLLAARTLA